MNRVVPVLLCLCLPMLFSCTHLQRELEPPQVRLDAIALESLSLSRQRFRVTLEVHNPNAFRLPIASITYHMTLADVPLTRGRFDEGLSLAAGASQTVNLSVETDLMATGQGLLEWLRQPSEDLPYRMEGEVLPDFSWARARPYRQEGRIRLQH
ncbi:LEA type 2 family protein [Natronospira bacteriovora]|uniref:LEA type 2 family protein n=1 Tax=Natronospira bacteriovora TaxID=3069753 RepID=A0ABU0W7S9_9GAMM|nr:LEA type 2 family protein [Natronospira sp. AB-CW4]MDQ2069968.1 LEA type 2 family protein [Natronospira sp. AB-CW4]